MRSTIETRLAKLEQQHIGPAGFKVWIGGDDDDMLGPHGETMTRAELDALYPNAIDIGTGETQHEEH